LGVNVFVLKKYVLGSDFVNKQNRVGVRRHSKEIVWGGTFLDEIVGGGIRFSLCNRLP